MKHLLPFILFISLCFPGLAQNKVMDAEVYDIWNKITFSKLSNSGDWLVYTTKPHKGDSHIHIHEVASGKTYDFSRGQNPKIDYDNAFVAFTIKPAFDSIFQLKKQRVSEDKHPNDTLAIFYFEEKKIEKIPNVESFQIPDEWGGTFAYKMKALTKEMDSLAYASLSRKENEENGTKYIVRNANNREDLSMPYCKSLHFSPEKDCYIYHSTGSDSIAQNLLYFKDLNVKDPFLIESKQGDLSQYTFSENGKFISYTADRDTGEVLIKQYELHLFDRTSKRTKLVADNQSKAVPKDWIVSNEAAYFSKDEKSFFYYIRPNPPVQDTSLLDEEIVDVEVWTSDDKLLYTQQEIMYDDILNQAYLVNYNIGSATSTQLADKEFDEVYLSQEGNGNLALGSNVKPYQQLISWRGYPSRNLSLIDISTGKKETIIKNHDGFARWSPEGHFVISYSRSKKIYQCFGVNKKKWKDITDNKQVKFYNERHDQPSEPWNYGICGWHENDEKVLIYDHFDIWEIDPNGKSKAKRITEGREKEWRYRWINLDPDLRTIPKDTTLLLHIFDEKDKSSGYAYLDLATNEIKLLEKGPHSYTRRVKKSKDANKIIYTKEDFNIFPDLIVNDLNWENPKTVSKVNPQQKDYAWGSIELISWKDNQGKEVEGMLVRPAGFKEGKKYPMIVNFYERSSQNLHRHRAPFAHRSTINYSYYASKGYVIFNPDVRYEVGKPGDSALEAVMTGVDKVVEFGFVDESKIGLQGHSWGGYQVAHILTKTNRFVCAESGAPVVNMTSAYGGIRWRSGMSRMFQYEKTQSRLGATLWEDRDVYLDNSPLFNLDKMHTPVLILHNDKDGAVPWYQGIEYFVALRRLGKKAWFLNYNDEPHWPVKRQNRLDFNQRMEQFFGYYLMGDPMPRWMLKGVPATEKGINQGLEYLNK